MAEISTHIAPILRDLVDGGNAFGGSALRLRSPVWMRTHARHVDFERETAAMLTCALESYAVCTGSRHPPQRKFAGKEIAIWCVKQRAIQDALKQFVEAEAASCAREDQGLRPMNRINFTALIADETAKFNALHAEVNRTCLLRDRDATANWMRACEAFHSYVSPIDPYIERACEEKRYGDNDLLEFVIRFLELNPMFFRSGYLKQEFLTRLKRSDLGRVAVRRLRAVLLDAVKRRGTREFKCYCRLASVIADQDLIASLEMTRMTAKGAEASRARVMLRMIRQNNAWHAHRV